MSKCINYESYDKSNFDLFGFCFLIKSFIFLRNNLYIHNKDVNRRKNEIIDCLISDQFFKYNNYINNINFNNTIKYLYSSVVCISFNRNDLLKTNRKMQIFVGGSNIKLSHPKYYLKEYNFLINTFNKNLQIFNKDNLNIKKFKKNEEKILFLYFLSEGIEFIINKADVSIDNYNKNIFAGTSCNHPGEIIPKEINKICQDKKVRTSSGTFQKFRNCPQVYNLIHNETNNMYNYKTDGTLDLNDRINNYDDITIERLCCKDKNDAEIDLLLSILRYYLRGENIYEKYNNLWNFIENHFLNVGSNNYIGNFGFFCLDKFNNPMTPCWICNKWLSHFNCNFFNCIKGITNNALETKYKLNQWLPLKTHFRIIDILQNKINFGLKTSMCYLTSNIDKKNHKQLQKKRDKIFKIKYLTSEYNALDMVEYLKQENFRFTEWKYYDIKSTKTKEKVGTETNVYIHKTDLYEIVINKLVNYNKKIYKLLLC
jgi:hypothetical protein